MTEQQSSETQQPVLIEDHGSTRILSINLAHKRNAISLDTRLQLLDALIAAEADNNVRAVILTGKGGNFSAGGDINAMEGRDVATGRMVMRATNRFVRQIMLMGKPVIAAVEGWAAGAGFSLALLCDTIVAADNARFMPAFGKVGLIADLGMLHTLPHRVGRAKAKQILFSGRVIEAQDAYAMDIVDHLAAPNTACDKALEIAALYGEQAPLSLAVTKTVLAAGLDDLLERESDLQTMLFQSEDHKEGRLAFLEKRKPVFKGK